MCCGDVKFLTIIAILFYLCFVEHETSAMLVSDKKVQAVKPTIYSVGNSLNIR